MFDEDRHTWRPLCALRVRADDGVVRLNVGLQPRLQNLLQPRLQNLLERAERESRSRETALSKTDMMILRLLLPHERFFSSLVFATVAHSAPSLGSLRCLPATARHRRTR